MPKPPATPPSSDIDGIHEDETRNTDAAIAAGQDTEDLARAGRQTAARPEYSDDEPSGEDRSR